MSEKTVSTQSAATASQSADKSRMLSIIAISLAALMVLLIAIVFWRMIAIGRDAATAYSQPSKSASTQAPETTAATTEPAAQESPDMTLKQGREKLSLLTDNSLCQGETDAAFLIDFARLSEEAGQWDADKGAVNARLKELPEKCGETYATNLANRLRSASTPSGLAELVSQTLSQAGTDKRPAPEGSIDIEDFYTPSGNIQCAFDNDRLSCTISEYDYTSESCQGTPVTYSISYDGTAKQSCGTPVTSDSGIAYNTTVAHGGLACTITQDGVECWHEASGKGFKLSRSAVSTF